MIKYSLLVFAGILFSSLLYAQPTLKTLTKEETVFYMDKKMREAIGHEKVMGGTTSRVNDNGIRINSSGKIELRYRTDGTETVYREFNPAHIKSIKQAEVKNSDVGVINVQLIGKTAVLNEQGIKSSVDVVYINFLQTDPDNYSRLLYALQHLRDLYKAE